MNLSFQAFNHFFTVAKPIPYREHQIYLQLLAFQTCKTFSACIVHCRYCFRQNYPYEISDHTFEKEIEEIVADASLHEVILSGGDPLSLSDETLRSLFERLNAIPHIRRVPIHTRFPMGIPERIDASFLGLLETTKSHETLVKFINVLHHLQ